MLAAMFCFGLQAEAQRPERGKRLTPEEMAEQRTALMVQKYGLNQTQTDSLFALNMRQMEQMKDMRPERIPRDSLQAMDKDARKAYQKEMKEKEAGMRDQVMIYTGDRSFAESCQKADINVAVHPYVYSADDVDSYRKGGMTGAVLFQYGNTCIYGDNPADPEIGRKIRAKGFLSYTNLLGQYDNAMLNGDFGYVRQFVDSESDFVQTDYCEKVIEYLELVELR